MAIKIRRFKESPWPQGEDENIAYSFSTAPWGGSLTKLPTNPSAVIKDEDGEDVSDECLEGSCLVDGIDIITPFVYGLTKDQEYRLEVLFDVGDNTYEVYGIIKAEE